MMKIIAVLNEFFLVVNYDNVSICRVDVKIMLVFSLSFSRRNPRRRANNAHVLNAHVSHSRNRQDDKIAIKARKIDSLSIVGNRISGTSIRSNHADSGHSYFFDNKKCEIPDRFSSCIKNSRFSLEKN